MFDSDGCPGGLARPQATLGRDSTGDRESARPVALTPVEIMARRQQTVSEALDFSHLDALSAEHDKVEQQWAALSFDKRLRILRICRRWGCTPAEVLNGDRRDRALTQWAIGRLKASAHEKLLLQAIEADSTASRVGWCTAPPAELARRCSLSEAQVGRLLRRSLHIVHMEDVSRVGGFRVVLSAQHLKDCRTELRRMWSRPREGGSDGWLDEASKIVKETAVRLLWRRVLLGALLPARDKGVGLAGSLLTDATGDAPWRAFTVTEIAALSGYCARSVLMSLDRLRTFGLITTAPGAQNRGLWVRLRFPSLDALRQAAERYALDRGKSQGHAELHTSPGEIAGPATNPPNDTSQIPTNLSKEDGVVGDIDIQEVSGVGSPAGSTRPEVRGVQNRDAAPFPSPDQWARNRGRYQSKGRRSCFCRKCKRDGFRRSELTENWLCPECDGGAWVRGSSAQREASAEYFRQNPVRVIE